MEDAPEEAPKRPERRAPAKPSDLLGQRRAMASRTFRDTPKATSERLRAHAEKYGVDQVAETGAEAGMDRALGFTLSVPGVCVAIVGTQKPGRWQENAALVAKGPLPSEQFQAIRERWKQAAKPDWVGQV